MNSKNLHASRHLEAADMEVHKNPHKKKKKKHSKVFKIFKKLMTVIATTLLSLILVIIITGTIVSTALTVYVLKFMDDSTTVTLQELESGSDTFFYANHINEYGELVLDEQGNPELEQLYHNPNKVQRIPVSIDKIPQHVRQAFICTEDERFYAHEGVDYKRTFSAFLNMFLHFYNTEQGGSTITQQLVKNLSGNDQHTTERKIREIFAAMQLEKSYTKDEILEEYLNYIAFGGPRNGIQKASIDYFGKDVSELTTPEAAVLAAIPKSPEDYGPFVIYRQDDTDPNSPIVVDGKANNKPRQEYVLYKLYENGYITYDEYQEYLVTPIIYTDSEEYKRNHPEEELKELEAKAKTYSWILDAAFFEAEKVFMDMYDITEEEALSKIQRGGYQVYIKYDKKMQDYVENQLRDFSTFQYVLPEYSYRRYVDINGDGTVDEEEALPHVAFCAINYRGEVLCAVGTVGEKKDSLVTNYAVKEPRQVGSTIKPLAGYGYGIDSGKFHWGSVLKNSPVRRLDDGQWWPKNYGGVSGNGGPVQLWMGLRDSMNTISAQLVVQGGQENVFDYAHDKLGLELSKGERGEGFESPLTLGALTNGVTLENLVNAYIPYGNQGMHYDAHLITMIKDSNQQIIYQCDGNPKRAVEDETAYVMNRLMKIVIESGTGTDAKIYNKTVVGKTGTTQDFVDECFVGLTPDFASGITVGYKSFDVQLTWDRIVSAKVWRTVIGDYIINNYNDTPSDFEKVSTVIEAPICSNTGNIAGANCARGAIGYWKSICKDNADYKPPYCSGAHSYQSTTQATTAAADGGASGGGAAAGGNAGGGAVAGGDAGGGAAAGGDAGGGAVAGGDAGGGAAAGGDAGGGAAPAGGDAPAAE
ncbi:MAG: transglycosylase domain-containing protein [Ruminococcus sp.]|uniref:transglycosylase domain-containing protein n=1 Tax=Ruminococcus sp. TaxID=41978 RepID=UPI0025F6723D|nr:transglycosylase domain-containing protein [Ruminococcus sp.]MBR5681871.1 transglycosylase domain-containing protein [Ruminococcus sp.]